MNDWRTWNGLREVKREDLVRVKFRCGRESRDVLPAVKWSWKWIDGAHPFEIVAYQKVADDA